MKIVIQMKRGSFGRPMSAPVTTTPMVEIAYEHAARKLARQLAVTQAEMLGAPPVLRLVESTVGLEGDQRWFVDRGGRLKEIEG